MSLLEEYIGGLPSIKRKETWKDVTPEFPKGLTVVDVPKNSEPQSTVAMVWKGDFKWQRQIQTGFHNINECTFNKMQGIYAGRPGRVYGVSMNGSTSRLPKPKYSINSSWGCNPDNIRKLSQTVLDEMRKIKKEGPTDIDLNKVKETLIRGEGKPD